jgi:predicted transcriptional regulator of viral defense system
MLSRSYLKLRPLREKLFFGVSDVASLLAIKRPSARILCFRYARDGLFIRLKNDMYVMEDRWRYLERRDYFALANYLQVPSYVSLGSALAIYGVTTQVQQSLVESDCLKRTRSFECSGAQFYYFKLKKELYNGFIRKDGYFIATAEKAFLDAVYLYSFGKYKMDFPALDAKKLDFAALRRQVKAYPEKTRKMVSKLCRI